MKFLYFLCLFLLTACVGGDVNAAGGTAIPLPETETPGIVFDGDYPVTWTPKVTGTLVLIVGWTPDYRATAEAKTTDQAIMLQYEYLSLQQTHSAQQFENAATYQAQDFAIRQALVSAEVYALRLEAEARTAYTCTLAALVVTQTSMPIRATSTQQAIDAAAWSAELADDQAQSTNQAADATAAAGYVQTQAAQNGISFGGTITADIAKSTQGAPATATVEAQRLVAALNRTRTGYVLLQVIVWATVILGGLGLLGWECIALSAKWNREAVQQSISLGQASLFRGADGGALAWNGIDYQPVSAPAPLEAATANPVPPVPIYGVGNPGPQVRLSEMGLRCIEIIKASIRLYGGGSLRIATHRVTTGSGDTWTSAIQAMRAAGIVINTNGAGEAGQGTYLEGLTLAELEYDIETGEVRL